MDGTGLEARAQGSTMHVLSVKASVYHDIIEHENKEN